MLQVLELRISDQSTCFEFQLKCDRLYVFINLDSYYENPALAGTPLINDD